MQNDLHLFNRHSLATPASSRHGQPSSLQVGELAALVGFIEATMASGIIRRNPRHK